VNILWYINCALILSGIAVLGISIYFSSRIIFDLNPGPIKTRWHFLRAFIVVFLAGYLAFLVLMPHEADINTLIVSGVFALGAVFVLLVSWITLHTVQDIRRVAAMEQEIITDPLLGIYNRRYLEQRLDEEVSRFHRHRIPLSILIMDVDCLKQVNDVHGHLEGDAVLAGIGAILKAQIRKGDLAARYGGDEVVVLCTGTENEEALLVAERLRQSVETSLSHSAAEKHCTVQCTVSIGVTSLLDEGCSATELLRQADVGLYHAKHMGRNRVVAYNSGLNLQAC
jgi:diguanylate cyclase (GGDEF)-like protein